MSTQKGLLLVLVDPAPSLEEELNAWYDTEHLPERAALPGFETALRFTSLGDGPRYAALYDLTDLDVLRSAGYLAVSGDRFSPWTKRVTGRSHPARLTARQVAGSREATGKCLRFVILKFRDTTPDDLPTIAAGLEASYGGHPACLKWRIFAGAEPAPDFTLVLAEFGGPVVPSLSVEAFGAAGRRIEAMFAGLSIAGSDGGPGRALARAVD